jgi:hypothetical protein
MKYNNLVENSVTTLVRNSSCIVCGTAFPIARAGKLYCSTRCKQFGFYHRNEINQTIEERQKGISQKEILFFIDDYADYCRIQKMAKRFKELEKKRKEWDEVKQEIKLSDNAGVPIRNYTWDKYVREKLTAEEENELCSIVQGVNEDILDLHLKELSIEQWSFLKSLQIEMTGEAFFRYSSSISKEFLNQLRLEESGSEHDNQIFIIRNKFINHCNMIAEGIVRILKRDEAKMTE